MRFLLMKWLVCFLLMNLFCTGIYSQDLNENAKKYFEILKTKPTPGFMFDRFYGAWMESSDTKALEEHLKKLTVETPSSEYYLLLAFYYQKEGQVNRALNVFESIENEKLLTADILYYRAKLESSSLNFADAIKHIDKAIALPLKEALKQNLLKLKAQVQYRNGDREGARKTFEVLLAINEKDKSVIEDVMEIQLAEGMYEDAKKYCQNLVSLATDNYERVNFQLKLGTIHKRLNESDLAEKLYLDLINISGQDSWLLKEVIYQFESIYKGKDNLTDLVKKYEEIIKTNPQNVYLRKRFSSLLSEKGEKENSIKEFQSIVELLPGDRSIKEEYAGLLVSNNKTEEAVKVLDSISSNQAGKKDYEIIFRMAELEFKNKKLKNAYDLVELFLKKEDLSEYEIMRIGNLIQTNEDLPKIIGYYEKQLEKNPEYIVIKESLVNLYLENKEKDKALAFSKNLKLNEDIDLNIRLVNLFLKQKLHEEAIVLLQMLSEINKKTFKYNKKLYDIYFEQKNAEKSKEIADNLLKLSESFNEIRESLQLIRSHFSDKDLENQIKLYENLTSIGPKEILLLANLKYKAVKQEEAFKLVESNLTKFSSDVIFLELAENFFSVAKEFEKSLIVVDLLMKISPKESAKYLLLKTNLLRRCEKFDQAIETAKQLLVATNNKTEHVILIAELYQLKGEAENAIAILRKGSFENPDEKSIKLKLSDYYLQAQNINDSKRILWSLIENTEELSEKISYVDKLITSYEYDYNLDALIENLKERRLNNNKSTFPLLALIRVYQRLNDLDNKSKTMVELLQIKTEDISLYLELANVMLKDLNYDGAENAIRKAISVDKTDLSRKKLIQFYFSIDKEDEALMELNKLSKSSFLEKNIIEIAEKLITSEKYEKAYHFLKNNIPIDKTFKHQFVLAIASKEAKMADALKLLFSLLDINEEFAQNNTNNQSNIQRYDDNMTPEFLKEINQFQSIIWSYSSYKSNQQRGLSVRASYNQASFIMPLNLINLQNIVVAHLGELYRDGDETRKAEIINNVKTRNIKYADIKLSMDQNAYSSGQNIFSELALKNPNNHEFKILSAIYDRNFYNQLNSKLLPLLKEFKEYDVKLAFWLLANYSRNLTEISKEFLDEADSIVEKINPPDVNKINFYFGVFGSYYGRPKTIPDELVKKYKLPLLALLDKNFDKIVANNNSLRYSIIPALLKFNEHELYAKLVNQQFVILQKNKLQTRSSRNYGRYPNSFSINTGLQYPSILQNQLNGYFYELYNKNSSQVIEDEFIKKILPLLENKVLKLAIVNSLGDEAEEIKLIKELELDKNIENIQIVAAYYGNKQNEKEAILNLNKALMLPLSIELKKQINGLVAFYASKVDDPALKIEGVNAAKRLKNFNLSKEELLELSILFESMGESAEAEKLDVKISKMNTPKQRSSSNSYQNFQSVQSKFESMMSKVKNDVAFKFLISSLKPIFTGLANQIKNNGYIRIDFYSYSNILEIIKGKNLKGELIKFIADQIVSNEDDMLTSAIILFGLEEKTEAQTIVRNLLQKKPNDLFYKILLYTLNINKNQELDQKLKEELIKSPNDAFLYLNFFNYNYELFQTNILNFKSIYFHMIENIDAKNQMHQFYINGLIQPFLNQNTLKKNVYISSLLQKISNYRYSDEQKKDVEIFYLFFEEFMLKCIKHKVGSYYAASLLAHYYLINEKPISEYNLQILLAEFVESHNLGLGNIDLLRTSHNGENFMPLIFTLSVYLLNNEKGEVINSLNEKLIGNEKEKYTKFIDNLKKLTMDVPLTIENINQIPVQINQLIGNELSSFMLQLANRVKIKNKNFHELLFKTIKETLGKTYVNGNIFLSYLSNQVAHTKKEEIASYLLEVEKKILPQPFDLDIYLKNKNNYNHYSQWVTNAFRGNSYEFNEKEFELAKQIILISNKSDFYFYISRFRNNLSNIIKDAPTKTLLESELFNCSIADFQLVKYSDRKDSFLILDIISKLKNNSNPQQINEILVGREDASGIKLLKILLQKSNQKFLFEFLGTKLDEFNAMPLHKQLEWAAYISTQYKGNDKIELNEDGIKFKEYSASLSNSKMIENKNKFLNDKFMDEISSYEYLKLFEEIYPSLLSESDEKLEIVIKTIQRKNKYFERNSRTSRLDNYFHDNFVEKIISFDSLNLKHLKIVSDLLSQNQNWSPTYYQKYTELVKNYIADRSNDFFVQNKIAKNNGAYELSKELSGAFKAEFLKIINDTIKANNNVPVYFFDALQKIDDFSGKDNVLKEIVDEWEKELDRPSIKNELYYEFKSHLQKDKKILENYYVTVIENNLVKPQIKAHYIKRLLKNEKLDQELKLKIFLQHLSVFHANGIKFTSIPTNLYDFIAFYDYEILKINIEEVSKLAKNWVRELEKVELNSRNDDWYLHQFTVKNLNHSKTYHKWVKLLKDSLSEEVFFKVFDNPKLGFRSHFSGYLHFVKEGQFDDFLDTFNRKIELIKINREVQGEPLTKDDLVLVETFVKKIDDIEKQIFARVLFYRNGVENSNEGDKLKMFETTFKALIKTPVKDSRIRYKLLLLLANTNLLLDKEVQLEFKPEVEKFTEFDLKNKEFLEIEAIFYIYCQKFAKLLSKNDFAAFKIEVEPMIKIINERKSDQDDFRAILVQAIADNVLFDNNLLVNAKCYFEGISLIMASIDVTPEMAKKGFNYSLCLMYLSGQGKEIDKELVRNIKKWRNSLSLEDAIAFFKSNYLQNPGQKDSILKAMNEFLASNAMEYYRAIDKGNYNDTLDFIKSEEDQKKLINNLNAIKVKKWNFNE